MSECASLIQSWLGFGRGQRPAERGSTNLPSLKQALNSTKVAVAYISRRDSLNHIAQRKHGVPLISEKTCMRDPIAEPIDPVSELPTI
jgi:hypothetical protein